MRAGQLAFAHPRRTISIAARGRPRRFEHEHVGVAGNLDGLRSGYQGRDRKETRHQQLRLHARADREVCPEFEQQAGRQQATVERGEGNSGRPAGSRRGWRGRLVPQLAETAAVRFGGQSPERAHRGRAILPQGKRSML